MMPMMKLKNKGLLLIISGPSGVGKGTMCKELVKTENIFYSISATTRKAREGEVEGVNYYFKSEDEFRRMMEQHELLEWAQFCGNYYGTPKQPVLERIDAGQDVLLEIEVEGALQVKSEYPDGIFVFVMPPSMEELENRIRGRGTETDELIRFRMEKARKEMKLTGHYQYIVENDDVEHAVLCIKAILAAEKLRVKRNKNFIKEVQNS